MRVRDGTLEYNIGLLAEIFGLAPQTIHYYERIGILNPQRDEKNGYRVYSDYDFQQLASIKKLRNADFTLKDSSFLYDDENELDVYKRYKKKRKELMADISKKEFILEKLNDYIDKIENLWLENEFIIEEIDEYYRYNIKNNDLHDKYMNPWFKNLFFTASSLKFIIENEEYKSFEFGVLASRETFQKCKLEMTENVDKIRKGKFASRILKYHNHVHLEDIGNEINTYLNDNNLMMRSYPFSELLVSYSDEDKNKVNIVRIILPIY